MGQCQFVCINNVYYTGLFAGDTWDLQGHVAMVTARVTALQLPNASYSHPSYHPIF